MELTKVEKVSPEIKVSPFALFLGVRSVKARPISKDSAQSAFIGSIHPPVEKHKANNAAEKLNNSLADQSLLGNFIGMLTDSRIFLSYARHEYFRRILCNLLGSRAESGEYPNGPALLGGLVEDICYHNFDEVTEEEVMAAERWVNNYPRKILGWKSAAMLFDQELQAA